MMFSKAPRRPSVLLIYPHVAHYRREVLERLDADPNFDLTIAAAETPVEPGIELVPHSHFSSTVRLRHRIFGPLVWQSGVLRLATLSRHETVIYMGAVKYPSTWLAALISRIRGRRVLFWTIGWHRPESGIKRITRLAFYRLAHELLLYGTWGREFGIAAGYSPEKMRVIGNSVPSSAENVAWDAPVRPAGERIGQVTFGAVARLTPVKELDQLILAVSVIRKRGIDAGVLLAGDGEEAPRIWQLAKDTSVPLTMVGAVYSPDDIEAVYQRLDATVVPGAVGLSAIQSLAHGIPVITHADRTRQMPEAEAVIDGRTGLLYHRNEPTGLADCLERFAGLSIEELSRMRSECRVEVRRNWTAGSSALKIADAIAGP